MGNLFILVTFNDAGGIKDAQLLLRLSAKGLKKAGAFPFGQF